MLGWWLNSEALGSSTSRQKASRDQEARNHKKHLILEREMKPQSEMEKIATRRIAKAIRTVVKASVDKGDKKIVVDIQ